MALLTSDLEGTEEELELKCAELEQVQAQAQALAAGGGIASLGIGKLVPKAKDAAAKDDDGDARARELEAENGALRAQLGTCAIDECGVGGLVPGRGPALREPAVLLDIALVAHR